MHPPLHMRAHSQRLAFHSMSFPAALDDCTALGIGAHLGGVQCNLVVAKYLHLVDGDLDSSHIELIRDGGGLDALVLPHADVAGVNRPWWWQRGFARWPPGDAMDNGGVDEGGNCDGVDKVGAHMAAFGQCPRNLE